MGILQPSILIPFYWLTKYQQGAYHASKVSHNVTNIKNKKNSSTNNFSQYQINTGLRSWIFTITLITLEGHSKGWLAYTCPLKELAAAK